MYKSVLGTIILSLLACTPACGQSMVEMKQTALRDFEKADAELNATYKEVLAQLSPKGVAALQEAQRAWVVLRDKTAEAYGTGEEGGSNESLMSIRCEEATTRNRTKELRRLFLSGGYPY